MHLNFVYDVQKYAIIANLCLLSCISKPYSAKNLTTYLSASYVNIFIFSTRYT